MSDSLETIQINGKPALVAYFDDDMRMTTKESATIAKVMPEDGAPYFVVLTKEPKDDERD